jgi:uncharacterized protein YlxW (UPF0749 family)
MIRHLTLLTCLSIVVVSTIKKKMKKCEKSTWQKADKNTAQSRKERKNLMQARKKQAKWKKKAET